MSEKSVTVRAAVWRDFPVRRRWLYPWEVTARSVGERYTKIPIRPPAEVTAEVE